MDIDVFCETAAGYTAIECKVSIRWENKFQKGL